MLIDITIFSVIMLKEYFTRAQREIKMRRRISNGIELLRSELTRWARLAFGDQRVVAYMSRSILGKLHEAKCTHYCVGCAAGLRKKHNGTFEIVLIESNNLNGELTHNETHHDMVIAVPDHLDSGIWKERACDNNPKFPVRVEFKGTQA